MSKEQNFEVNLFPVISLLAVLISFLLLSAVWIQIGSIDVKQAVGQSSSSAKSAQDNPTLWVEIDSVGVIVLHIKNKNNKTISRRVYKPSNSLFTRVSSAVTSIKKNRPTIEIAFVAASPKTPYHIVVKSLELLKVAEFTNIGVSPLR